MDDYKNFKEGLGKILISFAVIHTRTLSKEFHKIYFEALKDLSIEKITKNAAIHLQTSRFFPMPVDLRGGPKRYDEEDFDDENGNIC